MIHPISTKRLYIKPIGKDDVDFVFHHFSQEMVNRYLYDEPPYTRRKQAEDLVTFYLSQEQSVPCRWIIEDKATGKRVGTCGFHCPNAARNAVEVGYDLDPAHWGKGYMAEAMAAILAVAFHTLHYDAIDAHIYVNNAPSIQLAERLGFQRGEELEKYTGVDGQIYDHYIYTLYRPQ